MKKISSNEYYNRVLGSWIGRVAGDFVGIPCELKTYSYIKHKYGVINYYPEPINLNQVNDDEMYEIVALIALEKYGIELSANDIAREWLYLLDRKEFIFTAERIAYNNLKSKITPPESGLHRNFYYDFIGAQMRADIWGQISPGCPNIAKEYANKDGCISHAGVGIEGEIFIAILLSQAFFEDNIEENIKKAIKFLPSENVSFYTQMIQKAIELFQQYPNDFKKARDILINNYWRKEIRKELLRKESPSNKSRLTVLRGCISQIHVLPNIGIIILSLLYGAKDKKDQFGSSICTAAMMRYDTDCNCGNIGAILGAQIGANNIPSKWKDPLKNSFSTYVKGYEKWKITELAQRITEVGKKVINSKCKNQIKLI